ncbi:hypothetical protein LBMAG42_03500 [Deltaproteobacteria bacterium]|nr:hypothetical protein LBMAG42_03500 [Deltaproteobacteria bacterium]
MSDLALDANAALHAKQLSGGSLGLDPIGVLELLAGWGVRIVATQGVIVEQNKLSLREHHGRWFAAGVLRSERVRPQELKPFANAHHRLTPRPGDIDIGLLVLAKRLACPVYTHDSPATGWARAAGILVVDVVDLAGFVIHRDEALTERVQLGHQPLGARQGIPRPGDWQGGLRETVAARPSSASTFARLDAWLPPSRTE